MEDRQARNLDIVEAYFASIDHGREIIETQKDPAWRRQSEEVESRLLDEDFEIHLTSPDGTPEAYHGRDQLRVAGTAWLAPWREYRTKLEEAIPIGDDQVVVVSRATGVPSDGSRAVEHLVTFLWTFADGRVVRMEHFPSRDEALQAAEAGHPPT